MSDTANILDQIYPLIQRDAGSIFPEFRFKAIPNGWEATAGEIHGVTASGHLYYYGDTPFCFKNHKSAEVITIWNYVKERRGIVEKRDIFRELANLAHYTLPALDKNTIAQVKKREEEESLRESFLTFTQDQLWTISGNESLEYCHNREYTDEDIKGMNLGYNPGWRDTEEYLLSEGYELSQIKAELKYLRFRDDYPVIIPQRDSQGRLVSLWGRRVKPVPEGVKDKGKYLPIDDARGSKSIPFNLTNVRSQKTVVGVEGIFDCLLPPQRGFQNVIVGWGQASPTKNQLDNLNKMGIKEVILIPDNDDSGRDGVERGLLLLNKTGMRGYVSELPPDCKDVDEFTIRYGVKELDKITSNPISGARWKGMRLAEKYDMGSDVDQYRSLDEFVSYQSSLKNPLDRKHGVEGFRVGLDLPESELDELIEEHCQRVNDQNSRKDLVSSFERIISMTKEGQPLDEITGEVRGLSSPLNERGTLEPIPFNMDVALEQIADMPETRVTGHHTLDKNARIVVPSLVVVGARTGHGKTTWGINQVRTMLDAEDNRDFTFIYFSLEVPQNLFSSKLLGAETGLDIQEVIRDIRRKRYRPEIYEAIEKYRGYTADNRFLLVDERGMSVETVSGYCRKAKDRYGQVGAVFVDYIGLLTSKEENQNVERQYAKVITGLSDLAHEIQCPVIAFSQMNREAVRGKDTKKKITARYPKIHELRYSGQIEQQADQVWGLFNLAADEYQRNQEQSEKSEGGGYAEDEYTRPSIAQIKLLSLKDRYGSGFYPIDFRMIYGTRIEEWDSHYDTWSEGSPSTGKDDLEL